MDDKITPRTGPCIEGERPAGELTLQTFSMPGDTNANGDIFGGWLVSQMDLAGAITAGRVARGRVVTVAIDAMTFIRPVAVGSVVSCHTEVARVGNTSVQVQVEVWARQYTETCQHKVTEGLFVFVAIDDDGGKRPIPRD